MVYDGKLDIATGMSAKSKSWKNRQWTWKELVERLSQSQTTNETLKEFLAAPREEQSKIKDVGGYVGGYLRGGKRSPQSVLHRRLMTLDIDFAHIRFWDDFQMLFHHAAVLHATHKHSEVSPRLRLIMPLSRDCTPDEYVAVSRKVAGILGIELFDNTTFETNRLMFWPSNPKDVEYYYEFQDGPWLDVDETLDQYTNWMDSSEWPTADRKIQDVNRRIKKQEDPELKKGIVGAFCRTYSISAAIEKFLGDCYQPAEIAERYTYLKGTTSAGMIVYEDKFAYSHHGTDPTGGILCNAFDLVRIHKFGHLDSEEETAGNKAPSFSSMENLAREDKEVKGTIAREKVDNARYDFSNYDDVPDPEPILAVDDVEWMKELEVDSKGTYLSTAANINLIFENDHRLRRLFRSNDFDTKKYVFGNLPWRRVPKPEPIRNVDYSGIRNYIEVIYGIRGTLQIDDSLALEFERNHYHPILEYFNSLEWDGVPRVDRLFIDYMGAPENQYTIHAARKALVGSVARVLQPGVKYDLTPTLVGAQGTGKSTLIRKLGREWFSDTFLTVTGKEALEQIQGKWLIEIAELSGFRKAEVETIKHFLSKCVDSFRPAYGRTSEEYPRQCTFWATTNNRDFLKDPTGNRRFLPIDVNPDRVRKSVFTDLDGEVDQLWAEALVLYHQGENLYIESEAEQIARIEQAGHSEMDERTGLIEQYMNRLLPENWGEMDLFMRRNFLQQDPLSPKGTIERDYVCTAEVWCECLGKEKEDMDKYKTRELNDILRTIPGWETEGKSRVFSIYGKQRYYARKLS